MGSWLERILAVACPPVDPSNTKASGCGEPAGQLCGTSIGATVDYVCASRIQAAEEAARPRGRRHKNSHMDRGIGPWRRIIWTCDECAAWITYDGRRQRFSRDSGATWTPGPDACPGRPSGTEQGEG